MPARASVAVLSFMQRRLGSLKRAKVSTERRETAKWSRALSSPEAFLNRDGGAFAAMSGVALALALTAAAASPAGVPPRVLDGSQEMGADFAVGP